MPLVITGHQDGKIRVFDVHEGKMIYSFMAFDGGVASLAISPDGFNLMAGGTSIL